MNCLSRKTRAGPGRSSSGELLVTVARAAAEGYGEYRTHNALMDDVMGTYN